MTIYEHLLEGCAPVPLAGYLKALGIFRLVAEQKDADARGCWRNERFVLKTRLSREELVGFFVEEYEPSPIIGPWNKSSGYWKADKPPRRAVIESVLALNGARYDAFRAAAQLGVEFVSALGIASLPAEEAKSKPVKASLIASIRDSGDDGLAEWIDSVVAFVRDTNGARRPSYAPLLGKGAIDARLDFAFTFADAQVSLASVSGSERRVLCQSTLFSDATPGAFKRSLGQFDPSAAGGYNAGNGFEQEASANPFDGALAIEGIFLLAAGVARRNAAAASQATFPFMTTSLGSGSGATHIDEETGSNADFWAPLWERSASLVEVRHLFREGRAILPRKAAENSLDFLRAVASLGMDRSLTSFQRFGFYQRAGDAHRATPIGRATPPEVARDDLIADFETQDWLMQARDVTRYAIKDGRIDRTKEAPVSLRTLGQFFDESLFRLAAEGSPEVVQDVLIVLGALIREIAKRSKQREVLSPPPFLSAEWTKAADDGSHEFALAAALASLDAATMDESFCMPFRRHLAPLGRAKGRDAWDDTTEAHALAVWTGRNLVRDMGRVLERRLIEAQRKVFVRRAGSDKPPEPELPLHGWRTAPLYAVAAFLEGRTDDNRIAALAAGLAWARTSAATSESLAREDALPFAYAALKPLFTHSGIENETGRRFVDPLPLVRLLRADRGDEAAERAQRMARGAGLPTPFASRGRIAAPMSERLAAALLFPLAPVAVERLIARAYPEMNPEGENTDAA